MRVLLMALSCSSRFSVRQVMVRGSQSRLEASWLHCRQEAYSYISDSMFLYYSLAIAISLLGCVPTQLLILAEASFTLITSSPQFFNYFFRSSSCLSEALISWLCIQIVLSPSLICCCFCWTYFTISFLNFSIFLSSSNKPSRLLLNFYIYDILAVVSCRQSLRETLWWIVQDCMDNFYRDASCLQRETYAPISSKTLEREAKSSSMNWVFLLVAALARQQRRWWKQSFLMVQLVRWFWKIMNFRFSYSTSCPTFLQRPSLLFHYNSRNYFFFNYIFEILLKALESRFVEQDRSFSEFPYLGYAIWKFKFMIIFLFSFSLLLNECL